MLRPPNIWLTVLATVAMVVSAAWQFSQKGIEHALAGLPHWSTSCPKNAAAILVVGQSQASNTGSQRHISLSPSRAFADGQCYYLRDPMPGTGGRGGTVWPEFADRLGVRVVIADIAISGSSIDQWTDTNQLVKVSHTLKQLRDAGYAQPLIVWMQGETDGARRTSAATYYSELRKLILTAPDSRWLITRESICYDKQEKWMPIDLARDQIAKDFRSVTIGPDLDKIGAPLRQQDRCHLTADGQAILANALSSAARPLLSL